MGLLGILSLIQIGVIPGLLITAQIKSLSPYDRTLLVLPLSCIANYFLVVSLTILGAYTQTALIFVLMVEIFALIFYANRNLLRNSYAIDLRALVGKEKVQNNTIRWIAISLLFFFTILIFKQIGTVFTGADVVVNWNRWAIDWFNGISPRSTSHYPQMLPVLYSITYQFIGTAEVELFAKLVPVFFTIMLMLTFLRMASLHTKNNTLYLLALILFWTMFSRMESSQSAFSGYADIPLAYFVLVAIFIFSLARADLDQINSGRSLGDTGQNKSNAGYFVLSVVIIAGGALTKHSALFLAAVMPVAWYFHFRNTTTLRQILIAYLLMLVIAGHWFIYKQIQIYSGADSSNLQYLSEIVSLPWYAKLWNGIAMVSSKISWLWIPIFVAGLFTPLGRAHAAWIFIPFFILWAIFASYDYRNLILALPSLAFILASGMYKLHEYFNKTQAGSRIYRGTAKAVLLLLFTASIYILGTPKISSDLIAFNNSAKRAIGVPEFNAQLYAFFMANPEPARIASTYYALSHLPGLKDRDLPASCNDLELLADNHAARYLIVEAHCPAEVSATLASKYKKRLEGKNLIFYEVVAKHEAQGSL